MTFICQLLTAIPKKKKGVFNHELNKCFICYLYTAHKFTSGKKFLSYVQTYVKYYLD